MPGIFNVGNNYNVNNKRISSRLTFDVGEKFSGKIIKESTIILEGEEKCTVKKNV